MKIGEGEIKKGKKIKVLKKRRNKKRRKDGKEVKGKGETNKLIGRETREEIMYEKVKEKEEEERKKEKQDHDKVEFRARCSGRRGKKTCGF